MMTCYECGRAASDDLRVVRMWNGITREIDAVCEDCHNDIHGFG